MGNIQPMGSRVLVKRSKVESKGGILLPDSAKEKPREGTVLCLGTEPVHGVKKGDRVLFSSYGGTEVPGEEDELILNGDDLLGVLEVL